MTKPSDSESVETPPIELTLDLLDEVSQHLSSTSRFRLKDVNQMFYTSFSKTLIESVDEVLLNYPLSTASHILQKFGPYFTHIKVEHETEISLEDTFPHLNNLVSITSYDCDVNELLDIIFFAYPYTMYELCLGYHTTANKPDLCQIPSLCNLHQLKLYNLTLRTNFLNELFFFVPETLKQLSITFLDCIDEATLKFMYLSFPNLTTLELHGDWNDSGLLGLNTTHKNLKLLALSSLKLSRPNFGFTFKPECLPALQTLFLKGNDESDDTTKVTKLLNHQPYLFTMLILQNFHLTNVTYTFTNHRFPALCYVSLEKCNFISKEVFYQLIYGLNLITLNLKDTYIEENSIFHLLTLPKNWTSTIQHLSLENSRIDVQLYVLFDALVDLYYFNLNDTKAKSYGEEDTNSLLLRGSPQEDRFSYSKKALKKLKYLLVTDSVLDLADLTKVLHAAPNLDAVEQSDLVTKQIVEEFPDLMDRIRFQEDLDEVPNFFQLEHSLLPYK